MGFREQIGLGFRVSGLGFRDQSGGQGSLSNVCVCVCVFFFFLGGGGGVFRVPKAGYFSPESKGCLDLRAKLGFRGCWGSGLCNSGLGDSGATLNPKS